MKKKRFSTEQIAAVLQQAEQGVPVGDLCRQVGISEHSGLDERPALVATTFYVRRRALALDKRSFCGCYDRDGRDASAVILVSDNDAQSARESTGQFSHEEDSEPTT